MASRSTPAAQPMDRLRRPRAAAPVCSHQQPRRRRPAPLPGGRRVDVVSARCCGLDTHMRQVVACRIVPGPTGPPAQEVRTFGTMTDDLLALADWLKAEQVTHVAMESTGVYWKPI